MTIAQIQRALDVRVLAGGHAGDLHAASIGAGIRHAAKSVPLWRSTVTLSWGFALVPVWKLIVNLPGFALRSTSTIRYPNSTSGRLTSVYSPIVKGVLFIRPWGGVAEKPPLPETT